MSLITTTHILKHAKSHTNLLFEQTNLCLKLLVTMLLAASVSDQGLKKIKGTYHNTELSVFIK